MDRIRLVFRIENYKGLIAKFAIRYWRMLPAATKAWIDVDDFINDGMEFVRRYVMPRYNVRKNTSFTTLLQLSIEQFYIRKLRDLTRLKRTQVEIHNPVDSFDPSNLLVSRLALRKVYNTASPELRSNMKAWFYAKSGTPEGLRPTSKSFCAAKEEFLEIAHRLGVDANVCRTVLESRKKRALL